MIKIPVIACLAVVLLFSPANLFAGEVDDLKRDMERTQTRLDILEAEDDHQNEKYQHLFELSGYGDGEYKITDQPGKNNEFRVHHLSIFFIKQISNRWRMFSEIEYEDAPKIGEEETVTIIDGNGVPQTFTVTEHKDGKIFVEVFTLEFYLNQYLNFRLGRFLTPGGIWNVDHYPPFVLTQERPQHIRKIFPQLQDGLQTLGSVNMAGVSTDYTFYVSNGQGHSAHGDHNENKAWGPRLKFSLPFFTRTEVGTSYYRESDTNDDDDYRAIGADLLLRWNDWKFQGEYAKGYTNFDAGGRDDHRTGYYGQLEYNIRKWTLGYRYDWYDPSRNTDDDRKTINTLAVNYHFTPYVVGKVENHWVDPQDSAKDNYHLAILSVAVYLGR
jgi:hypothetical protein